MVSEKCKTFTVRGWLVICPYCDKATNQQPTNAGYLKCPNCGKYSYNENYNELKPKA